MEIVEKKAVYNSIRKSLFGGKLSSSQVNGIENILEASNIISDKRQIAYILATIFHETAATMRPLEEFGKGRNYDYGKKLDIGGGKGKRVPYKSPDKLYYGRGYTQNTWRSNYAKLTEAAKKQGKNWDFLNNPELLLQSEPSAWASLYAMTTGLYTGKKLSDYIFDKNCQYVNARKIINGLDKASLIADYARKFEEAL